MWLITWNIQWARSADGRVDLDRVVGHARRSKPVAREVFMRHIRTSARISRPRLWKNRAWNSRHEDRVDPCPSMMAGRWCR